MDHGEGSPPPEKPLAERDLVLLHSQSQSGVRVIRSRAGKLEVGELRALREGAPIHGEVVRLSPTDHDRVYEVDVALEAAESPKPQKSGPAQVASAAYRAHWDAIFGAPNEAPN